MTVLSRINDNLMTIIRLAVTLMVPVMTGVVFGQVIFRYVFSSPFSWSEELSRFLLIWITCLGSAYAARKGMHISILFLRQRLKGAARKAVVLLSHVALLVFLAVGCYEGVFLSISEWSQRSPSMGLPMTFGLISVPVGFAMVILFTLEQMIDSLRQRAAGSTGTTSRNARG